MLNVHGASSCQHPINGTFWMLPHPLNESNQKAKCNRSKKCIGNMICQNEQNQKISRICVKTAFSLCNSNVILICTALPSAQYHPSNYENIGRTEAETVKNIRHANLPGRSCLTLVGIWTSNLWYTLKSTLD